MSAVSTCSRLGRAQRAASRRARDRSRRRRPGALRSTRRSVSTPRPGRPRARRRAGHPGARRARSPRRSTGSSRNDCDRPLRGRSPSAPSRPRVDVKELAVHPLSIGAPPQPRTRLLGPGTPAAPDEHSLLLLPSGSDRVRRSSPRRTRPSTLRCPLSGGRHATSNGTSTPLERVSGYNGPLLRRLARPCAILAPAAASGPNSPVASRNEPNAPMIGPESNPWPRMSPSVLIVTRDPAVKLVSAALQAEGIASRTVGYTRATCSAR